MFDSFKVISALAGLMKNKEQVQAAADRVKARLGELRAVGDAGSGAVRVTVDGRMQVLDVALDPALIQALAGPAGASVSALAGSLISDATNTALRQAQMQAREELAKEAKALGLPDIPGLDKLLGA